MLLHLHGVEVVERELGDPLNADGELASEVCLLRLEVDLLFHEGSGENVVTDGNVVDKDTFEFGSLGAQNFIFLERFQILDCKIADYRAPWEGFLRLFEGELGHHGGGVPALGVVTV